MNKPPAADTIMIIHLKIGFMYWYIGNAKAAQQHNQYYTVLSPVIRHLADKYRTGEPHNKKRGNS